MKLSEQVCTLEQAKRLKELGIEQKSICYHHFQKDYGFAGVQENKENHTVSFGKPPMITDMAYSAFTVAELGVMIPAEYFLPSNKDGAWWMSHGMTFEKTEAEARATMLIQLLQANKVTPAEVNQRLTQK